MSPRAAWRLETLGFRDVYDYPAGKTDWTACGLPVEGKPQDAGLLVDFIDRNIGTCHLDERVEGVRRREGESGRGVCPVVNQHAVVLGLLHEEGWRQDSEKRVEDVMESGPTTFRANTSVQSAAAYMAKNEVAYVLVTTSDGKLLGILSRQTADLAVNELGPPR